MIRLPHTLRWLAERARLAPTLLEHRSVLDSLALRVRAVSAERGWAEGEGDRRYAELLEEDPAEAGRARACVAVPETWLFRGRASFEALRTRLAERRAAGQRGAAMLSAGCASGAEPLSMALTALAAGLDPQQVIVDAVDVNAEVIGEALRAPLGGLTIREGVPAWATAATSEGDRVRIDEPAMRAVRFVTADLLRWAPPVGRYDVIFCRNLLIYLERDARRELMTRLTDGLRPDGLLVLGHAEAAEIPAEFRSVGPLEAFAFERGRPVERPLLPPPRRAVPGRSAGRDAAPEPGPRRTGLPGRRSIEECRELLGRGDWDAGERALRDMIRREPLSVEAHCLLADSLLRRDRMAEAEQSLRRAVYLDPRHETSLIALAEIADRTGRHELAERYRRRALEAHLDGTGA